MPKPKEKESFSRQEKSSLKKDRAKRPEPWQEAARIAKTEASSK